MGEEMVPKDFLGEVEFLEVGDFWMNYSVGFFTALSQWQIKVSP